MTSTNINSNTVRSLVPIGKILIPVEVTSAMLNKIKYLCRTINREEWSGVLFYSTEGSIKDLETFKIILEDVYPMDKGTGASTYYELDELLIGYRMDHPETLMMQIGHIHSHNVMGVFFSSVDTGELTDNAGLYNYYVSVVVNNYLDFAIRVAFVGESSTITLKDEDGQLFNINVEAEKKYYYYNAKIVREVEPIPVPDEFALKVKEIITAAAQKEKLEKEKAELLRKQSTVPVAKTGNLWEDEKKKENEKTYVIKGTSGTVNPRLSHVLGKGSNKKMAAYYQTPNGPINEDDYDFDQYEVMMEAFLIHLLEQHTSISVINRNLEAVLSILTLNLPKSEYANYASSTIGDYPEVYDLYFEQGSNMKLEFKEDLARAIEILEECKYAQHPLLQALIGAFEQFQEEFAIAMMGM